LTAAKGAAVAATDPVGRAQAAVAALEARVAALPTRLAERRAEESVLDRRGAPRSVPVLRLGEARAVALGPDPDSTGLLERTAEGSAWRVVGPHLPPIPGTIPLDPTGTVAGQPVHEGGLMAWLKAGRLFIWPILITFAIGLAILAVRTAALARLRIDPRRLGAVAERLEADDAVGAEALVNAQATPLDRILAVGIAARDRTTGAREALVEEALLAESARLHRGAALLLTLAGICPLLGLLGTVTGMIDLFSVIAMTGSGAARSVSGGISEALVTTQAGMLAAIPLLIGHALLARAAEKREHLLEQAACRVLGLEETP
jgi:biopolymer transport protein ExbB